MLFIYSLSISFLLKWFIGFNSYYLILLATFLFIIAKLSIPFIFKIELASAFDVVVHSESSYNISHIVSFCTIDEKIDVEAIIHKIKERAFIHPYYNKLKTIFYSEFGIKYWKKDPKFCLDDHIEVLNINFINNDEVYNFMNAHATEIRFPKNKPEWKIFIIPNLPNNKSGFMMKIHHGIADGLSLMNYMLNLGYSKEYGLVHIPKINSWQWIMIYLIGLIEMIKFAKQIICRKKDQNCFRMKKLTGKKNAYCSSSLDFKFIKNYSKTLGVSINAILLALLSKALDNYHQQIFKKKLNKFSIMIAASILPMPQKNQIYKLGNNISFLPQELYFNHSVDSFRKYVEQYQKTLKLNKFSYSIYIQNLAGNLIYNLLHFSINDYLMKFITNTHSAIYTSVPGPTTPISMFGYEVNDLFFFVSGLGNATMIFNVLTYNDKFNLACLVDEATKINCKELVKEFERLVHENFELKE